MDKADAVFARYETAGIAFHQELSAGREPYDRPDLIAEFCEVKQLLQPYAEAGDMRCQYALATILHLGLTCKTLEDANASLPSARPEATRWWVAASKQGLS